MCVWSSRCSINGQSTWKHNFIIAANDVQYTHARTHARTHACTLPCKEGGDNKSRGRKWNSISYSVNTHKPSQERPKPRQLKHKPSQERPKPRQLKHKPSQERPKPRQLKHKPSQERPKPRQLKHKTLKEWLKTEMDGVDCSLCLLCHQVQGGNK